MATRKRSWLTNLFAKPKSRSAKRAEFKTRFLRIESLEPRQLLTGSSLTAWMTPNPHPSGDQPADSSQLVALTNFSPNAVPPDPGTVPMITELISEIEQIYSDIERNPAARPAFWGENVNASANEVRLHLDDNGMLTQNWTIDWGDGSDPQSVSQQPWVIHQYAAAGQYTINVSVTTPDGTYSADSTGWYANLVGIGGGGGSGGGMQVSLAALPPTLHVGGSQTVAQGQAFALDNLAALSDGDAVTDASDGMTTDYSYSIDWGDGSPPFAGSNVSVITAGGTGTPFLGALVSNPTDGFLAHVFTDPGTYNVAVTVTENSSSLSDTQIIPVTVKELAPSISISVGGSPITDNTCNEGDTAAFTGGYTADSSFTDPVGYSWQMTDSEGNVVAQGTDPNLNYTFTYADTYTVSLVASVDNVQSAPEIETITVNNVAPTIASISDVTVSVGQAFNLSASFTDPNPNDTHTATVTWGNGSPLDTGAQVTEESSDGSTPGTISDSYVYTTPTATGVPDAVTVTLTDSEGQSAPPQTFNVTVLGATVALTDFTADTSTTSSQFQISYTVSNANAGPFHIDIYTSPDGSTPDQLLMSYPVTGSDLDDTSGTPHTVSFTPQLDDIQSNYHLIAVADANGATSGIEFDGGMFYAAGVTDPSQNVLYVFGSNSGHLSGGADTVDIYGSGDSTANSVVFDSTTLDYAAITPVAITGIHVRGEAGNDDISATQYVTLPLWLFGGNGTNTITDDGTGNDTIGGGAGATTITTGAGNDTISFGPGTTTLQEGNGWDTPEILDDSSGVRSGINNTFVKSGSDWSPTSGTGFNQGQAVDSGNPSDSATWTFANLDPTSYYDVYATWSPVSGASAQYAVWDGATELATPPAVDQSQTPADLQSAGTTWQELGVYQVTSGTLAVQIGSYGSSPFAADAVMIVPATTAPLTNLVMNSFGVDTSGIFSVTYTVNGENSPPFSIGIYGSSDGIHPTTLLQTDDINDPTQLAGGGTYTDSIVPDLSDIGTSTYLVAMLDCYGQVQETSKSDNVSAPLNGVFESDDPTLYVFGSDTLNENVTFSQDSSGTTTVTVNGGPPQQFTNVSSIYVSTGNADDTIDASGVSLPLTAYAGSGTDTIVGGSGNNEIYGGSGSDVLDGSVGQVNWIQGGSGSATIYGGASQDWLLAGSGSNSTYYVYGGAGTEKVFGGAGTNYLYGGSGLDNITGGSGTNFIYGNGTHDLLAGGSGNNYILPKQDAVGGSLASVEVENAGTPDVHYNYSNSGLTATDFTNDGNIDADGNPDLGDYDPGYGGQWTFNDFDSGVRLGEDAATPVAVYATWAPSDPDNKLAQWGAGWETDAEYTISGTADGIPHVVSGIDQTASPNSTAPPGDRPWRLLGVYDVDVGSTLTVTLSDAGAADGLLCISDVMIQPLWPTVSIRPTNITANRNVPSANAGDYVDWVDAGNPVEVPIEGQGSRVPIQLQASIDSLYYDIDGTTANDWQAILPKVAGLEFWTASDSGTRLTPDLNGNIIAQSLSGGTCSKTVYVSQDPTYAGIPTSNSSSSEQAGASVKNVSTSPDVPSGAQFMCADTVNTEVPPLRVAPTSFKSFADTLDAAKVQAAFDANGSKLSDEQAKAFPGLEGYRYFLAYSNTPPEFQKALQFFKKDNLTWLKKFVVGITMNQQPTSPFEAAFASPVEFQVASSTADCPSIAQKVVKNAVLTYKTAGGALKTATIASASAEFVEFFKTQPIGPQGSAPNIGAFDFHSAVAELQPPLKVGDEAIQLSQVASYTVTTTYTATESSHKIEGANVYETNSDKTASVDALPGSKPLTYSITFQMNGDRTSSLTLEINGKKLSLSFPPPPPKN